MAAVCAAVLAVGLAVADAHSLGGLSSTRITATFVGGAPQVTVHGCDNFTGTNGTSLAGRAATVAAPCNNRVWSVPLGSWAIQSNAAQSTGFVAIFQPSGLAVLDTSAGSSVSVRATVAAVGLGILQATAGVVASYTDASTYLRAQIRRGLLSGLLGDFVELYYGTTLLASVPYTVVAGSLPLLLLTRIGTTVSVRVDGALMISHAVTAGQSANLSGGMAGIYYAGANGIRIDDLAVTSAEP